MANRTCRVYGQAYAETGDVTAVLTVGGVEVFNGALAHSDEDREDLAFGVEHIREGVMEVDCVVVISGKKRNTQLNVAIKAMEDTVNVDRTLGGKAKDCSLTRIEQLEAGDMSPYSSSRVVFTVSYVYTI